MSSEFVYHTQVYRLRDSVSEVYLLQCAHGVNQIWNKCNNISLEFFKENNFKINRNKLLPLLKGLCKELGIHSTTVQGTAEQFLTNRDTAGTVQLENRSDQRSLPWFCFKASAIKVNTEISKNYKKQTVSVTYFGKTYKVFKDRSLPKGATITNGSFNKRSDGHWYIRITYKIEKTKYVYPTNEEIGIDLGIKATATLSNGNEYNIPDFEKLDNKIRRAQRARKKKQTRKLHRKKKNIRLDWLHKTTLDIAKQYPVINIGNVRSNDITKKAKKDKNKSLTKGVADACWYTFKLLLQYKAEKLGGIFKLVPEQYTTVTCSKCGSRSGPSGTKALGIRDWKCDICGSHHLRDVNAALNILRIGHNTPVKGTSSL